MSSSSRSQPASPDVPAWPLWAIAALLAFTLLGAAVSRLTGSVANARASHAPIVVSRELHFTDLDGGGILVTEAGASHAIATLQSGEDGFVRATLRSLARERRLRSLGPETPFRLTSRQDGTLTLEDPATGVVLDLAAFGTTNAAAFRRFLTGETP